MTEAQKKIYNLECSICGCSDDPKDSSYNEHCMIWGCKYIKKVYSIKYLVCAGYITSKEDGQRHFINGKELARLYQVDEAECTFFNSNIHKLRDYGTSLIILQPKADGNYKLDGK